MRKAARFVVDTHVHSQRHAAGAALKERMKETGKSDIDYSDLNATMGGLETYDNSPRLLYDMECYGVDMCILQPAFGMSNELNIELVEKYPDKFVAFCNARNSGKDNPDWTFKDTVDEIDAMLATGKYCGIGEGAPSRPGPRTGQGRSYNMSERMDELRLICDLGRKHNVAVTVHTGTAGGYPITHTFWPEDWHPYWIHDIAAEYPDVTIIFAHGGMQGGHMTDLVDQCILVTSNYNNVYLETGLYWTDLYYKALKYPNVGPEKLIWGTDWGASQPIQTRLGNDPQTFSMQVHSQGIVRHQVDVMGWALRQVERLDISQDDMNLILGGNAVRLFKLKTPFTRLFRL
ncbi:MAG: amidohydrolase [Oscillospiraceae bacterium]|nr:amidohydrolase [Oscillospiraceae bacterium]